MTTPRHTRPPSWLIDDEDDDGGERRSKWFKAKPNASSSAAIAPTSSTTNSSSMPAERAPLPSTSTLKGLSESGRHGTSLVSSFASRVAAAKPRKHVDVSLSLSLDSLGLSDMSLESKSSFGKLLQSSDRQQRDVEHQHDSEEVSRSWDVAPTVEDLESLRQVETVETTANDERPEPTSRLPNVNLDASLTSTLGRTSASFAPRAPSPLRESTTLDTLYEATPQSEPAVSHSTGSSMISNEGRTKQSEHDEDEYAERSPIRSEADDVTSSSSSAPSSDKAKSPTPFHKVEPMAQPAAAIQSTSPVEDEPQVQLAQPLNAARGLHLGQDVEKTQTFDDFFADYSSPEELSDQGDLTAPVSPSRTEANGFFPRDTAGEASSEVQSIKATGQPRNSNQTFQMQPSNEMSQFQLASPSQTQRKSKIPVSSRSTTPIKRLKNEDVDASILNRERDLESVIRLRLETLHHQLQRLKNKDTIADAMNIAEIGNMLEEHKRIVDTYEAENKRLYVMLKDFETGSHSKNSIVKMEMERLQRENFQLRSEIENLQQTKYPLVTDSKLFELSQKHAEERQQWENREAFLKTNIEQLRTSLSAADAALQSIHDTHDAHVRQLKSSHEQFVSTLTAKQDKLTSEKQQLQSELSELRQTTTEELREMKPSINPTTSIRNIIQPDDIPTVTELRSRNQTLEDALKSEREEHTAKMQQIKSSLLGFQEEFVVVRQDYENQIQDLESQLKMARQNQDYRPYSRVKELQNELEALREKIRNKENSEPEIHPEPSGNYKDISDVDIRREEKLQDLESRLTEMQNSNEHLTIRLEEMKASLTVVSEQNRDLQSRLDAAVQMSEQQRREKENLRHQTEINMPKLQEQVATHKHIADTAKAKAQVLEGQSQALKVTLKEMEEKLKHAPSTETLLVYERKITSLEKELRQKDADLEIAKKYQSPTMQHFLLLEAKIKELEFQHHSREQQLQRLLMDKDRTAQLEREEIEKHWKLKLQSEAGKVSQLQVQVDELLNALRRLNLNE